MKSRALIDLRTQDPRGFLSALKQRDFAGCTSGGSLFLSGSEGLVESPLSPAEKELEDCIVSLPLAVLAFRILQLPFSDPGKIREVIPYELDSLILGGSEAVVFDIAMLRSSDGGSEVLVVCLHKEVLDDLLQTLAPHGIDPRVVTAVDLRAVLDAPPGEIAAQLAGAVTAEGTPRLKAVEAELAVPAINLRTGPFAFKKDIETLWKKAGVAGLLICLLAFLTHVLIGIGSLGARADADRVRASLRKDYSALFPQEKKVTDELHQLRSHVKVLRDKQGALLGVSPLQMLKMVSERQVRGVFLTEFTLDRDSVTLRGEAPSVNDVDLLKAALATRFPDLRASDIKTGPGGRVLFTMSGRTGAP